MSGPKAVVDFLQRTRSKIIAEWTSYGGQEDEVPLNLTLEWLDSYSTVTKPLTGSCHRPIVCVILSNYTLVVNKTEYKPISGYSEYVLYFPITDLDGAIIKKNQKQVGWITHQGHCLIVNEIYGKKQCIRVNYSYILLQDNTYELVLLDTVTEPFLKIIIYGGGIMCIKYSQIPEYTIMFDRMVKYCVNHELTQAYVLHDFCVTAQQKAQLYYLGPMECTKVINNPELDYLYQLYQGCWSLVITHRQNMVPHALRGKTDLLQKSIDKVTLPFPPLLYTICLKRKYWETLTLLLKYYHPKFIVDELYNNIVNDTTGRLADLAPSVGRHLAWRINNGRYRLLKYLERWDGVTDYLKSCRPLISSPLRNNYSSVLL